jgi:peroxiredoxin
MVEEKWPSVFRSWLRTGFIYVVIVVVASILGNLWLSRDQAGGQAPPLFAQNVNSGHWQTVKVADFEGPVLVYFFADWCPICKIQNHTIESINENYPVIAIAMQSGNLENVREYVRDHKLTMSVLNDEQGSLSRDFGVTGVPASFIINPHNEIRFSTRGYATELGLLSRLWMAQLE